MKTTKLLGMLSACALLLMQGCTKKEAYSTKTSKGSGFTSDKRNDVVGTIETGSYKIITFTDVKTVGVVGASGVNFALIEQRGFATDKGQEWAINSEGGGEYTIVNINSGKALEIPFGVVDVGAELWQNTVVPNNQYQRWIITEVEPGIYRIAAKVKTSPENYTVGLNVENGSSSDGGKIVLQRFINDHSKMKIQRVAYASNGATNFFKRTSGWIAGDGSCSVKMSNGKVIWMMDDSNINTYDPSNGSMSCNQAMVKNAALIQDYNDWDPANATTVLGPGSTSLADSELGHPNYNWLYAGFESGGYIYWKASTLNGTTEVGPDRFAKYQITTKTMVSYPLMPGTGSKKFGYGFVVEGDSVYAYGVVPGFIVADVYVAKFAKANPMAAWTFWTGSGWSPNPAAAAVIGESANYVPFVSKVGSKYVMVSTDLSTDCSTSNGIYTSVSNSPTGPFSVRKKIYSIPDKYNGLTARFYWGMAHPEYINTKNEVLFTYNVNAGLGTSNCGTVCIFGREDPNRYRPRAIRVPLKLIDATY